MTVADMLDQFEIQGYLRIQRWDGKSNGMDVFYDDVHDNDLINKSYWWLYKDIAYMYPSTTYSASNIEVPQIVIEIED